MPMQPEHPSALQSEITPRNPRSLRIVAALALCAGAFLGAFAVAFLASNSSMWDRVRSALGGTTRFDMTQPSVVNRIQQLQRLETVVYSMDKIVSGERGNPILPDFLAGDRLLMLVHGEVVAGIDFGSLQPGSVQITGKRVRLRLPQSQVFTTRLDSGRTRVYSRQTGLLVSTDPDLETQVRQEAEHQLHDAAIADGVLKTARQNAQTTLTSLLQGLGFTEVQFD